nr:shikimate 5-dehydrogenase [uncultured Acidocella sp.]
MSIDKDTTICISLAARPSNFGTRFHNYLYQNLGLNYIYKACTTEDLEGAIRGLRALKIRGCGVSMPYKEACIPLLDELTPSAAAIQSVNTIVNENGRLVAYNTDFIAVRDLLRQAGLPPSARVALRGSGGMAKAVAYALKLSGYENGIIIARNEAQGRALAQACGYEWAASMDGVEAEYLLNATPIGMAGGPEEGHYAFPEPMIERASAVMDVVAVPAETPLVHAARQLGKSVVTGAQIVALQALEQFILYTGRHPDAELFAAATAHARAG